MATMHLPRPHGPESFGVLLERAREGFWILALGVLIGFAFFGALGAFDLGESASVTIGIAVLALLWIGHVVLTSRHPPEDRDPRLTHDRERRGF